MNAITPSAVRMRLRDAGFSPIPLRGKNPGMKKGWAWEKLENVTDEQIAMWDKSFPDARNTGVLTKPTPRFDVDVLHTEAAEAAEAVIRDHIEDLDGITLVRIGLAPKRAIPFRASAPFSKISQTLQATDGSKQLLEFLANGQQLACYGIHPDTQQPYRWHGGELGDIRWQDLPIIDENGARKLVTDVASILSTDFGFMQMRARKSGAASKRSRTTDREHQDPTSFWGRVNQAALQKLDQWVPKLFPDASFYENTGAYRVKPNMLKRDCEEDLSIAPIGIVDWGIWEDDDRHGARSAIDIVVQWGKFAGLTSGIAAWGAKEAALWLCEQIEIDPKELGWGSGGVTLDDLYAYMPAHQYIYAPTRELWPGASVNARIGNVKLFNPDGSPMINPETMKQVEVAASAWLDRNHPVEQTSWAPGQPMLIKNKLITEGGWIDRNNVTVFNQYKGPVVDLGNASLATPWVEHIHKVYQTDAEHIIVWLAHRRQRPYEKINHALFLGGHQGIGKDTILEPVRHAVGPWNFQEVNPIQILGRFNGFIKSVILRVSEARDLGDVDRFALYDHLKTYTAAPPDVLRCDEKHLREHYVFNVTGLIITSNHKIDGIYLPADDRRHYVAWTDMDKSDFEEGYFDKLWQWYEQGGIAHVVAYLNELDLSGFNPKAPPPKTAAFWEIVAAGEPDENAELRDLLDGLGNPAVVTIDKIAGASTGSLTDWLTERKNRRIIRHRLEAVGYVLVPNGDAEDRLWKISGKRQAVYGRADMPVKERLFAAMHL